MGDNREAIARYRAALESGDLAQVAALTDLATDDFVQEWPQSGERIQQGRLEEDQRAVHGQDG